MAKKELAALGVALALLEPAAAGVKFGKEDLDSEESLWQLYQRWGARYNVARDPADKLRRFAVFKDAARRIHLREAAAGRAPGLNGFADLTNDEFSRVYKCAKPPAVAAAGLPVKRRGGDGTLPLPPSFSWRTKSCGARPCLGPVKSQGDCGACWAFTATGALEAYYAIRGARDNRDPVRLSEQELVDCDTQSLACEGGEPASAFGYVMNKGLASSISYPYTANNGTCKAAAAPRVDLVMRGYETLPANDEFELLQAVTYGPVAISIAVGDNNTDFQGYDGGMYSGACSEGLNDHAMLLVGYGFNYYIIRNSYGDLLGNQGYMFLKRDYGNSARGTCGILSEGGTYPELGI
ncbi:unnamed protein product [Urochloa decumbens]|uniref:Uncharacterized protein n=1 Tax=Urochloa decumbens TaxID=240449 RepID=A0ABC8YIA2_9POAL